MKFKFTILLIFIAYLTSNAQSKNCIGDCENGKGTYVDSKGNRYEGTWTNGHRNGNFRYFFSNGDKFEGIVINDIIDGEGVYETSKGTLRGRLLQVNNTILINGKGEKIKQNGDFEKGIFKNNELNGLGEEQIGRQIKRGNFIDGLLEGEGYLKYENGSTYKGNFLNGSPNGKGRLTYLAGGFKQGNWLNGECIDCQSKNTKSSNAIDLLPDNLGGFNVSVNFEGQLTINMMFDTGAHLVLLKKEHFDSLLAEGKIKGPGIQTSFIDAGGNNNPTDVYIISKLTIGKYELHDVACAINKKSTGAPNLFGMSAIRKLGKSIKINLEHNYLEIEQ
jgi:hypothetical protein